MYPTGRYCCGSLYSVVHAKRHSRRERLFLAFRFRKEGGESKLSAFFASPSSARRVQLEVELARKLCLATWDRCIDPGDLTERAIGEAAVWIREVRVIEHVIALQPKL